MGKNKEEFKRIVQSISVSLIIYICLGLTFTNPNKYVEIIFAIISSTAIGFFVLKYFTSLDK